MYFCQAGVLFSIEEAKFWLFCCNFTHFLVFFYNDGIDDIDDDNNEGVDDDVH